MFLWLIKNPRQLTQYIFQFINLNLNDLMVASSNSNFRLFYSKYSNGRELFSFKFSKLKNIHSFWHGMALPPGLND